eukprot:105732-Rhodomonas_salina.1
MAAASLTRARRCVPLSLHTVSADTMRGAHMCTRECSGFRCWCTHGCTPFPTVMVDARAHGCD